MKIVLPVWIFAMIISLTSCGQSAPQSQNKKSEPAIKVGGNCEGCEAVYESPVPFEKLNSVVTLPDYNEPGPKMEISGTIYKADGTPAPNVVLYVYHTDQTGKYTTKGNEKEWRKRHGYIRGWLKTNAKGEYKFYTLRPAPYPGEKIQAHIHPVIKEPDFNEYYIDEIVFDDDPVVNAGYKDKMQLRGGDGVMKLYEKNGILLGHRDIILGLNIPNYPKTKTPLQTNK